MPSDRGWTGLPQAALQPDHASGNEARRFSCSDEGRGSISSTSLSHSNKAVGDLLTASFAALDMLHIGVIVCGTAGQMLVANDTAQEILQVHDGLELDGDGVPSAALEKTRSLGDVIRRTAKVARSGRAGNLETAFAIRRPSGKRPLTLFVRAVNEKSENPGPQEAAVLVMILDAALRLETAESELRQLYGFTATEAQVAKLLMEGLALEDCCSELGIRRTTVRMHLRNIFAKTGVRRQGELVSLLLKSIGLGPSLK